MQFGERLLENLVRQLFELDDLLYLMQLKLDEVIVWLGLILQGIQVVEDIPDLDDPLSRSGP